MKNLSVTDAVVQHLQGLIITNVIKPGQKLNEIELANNLNISRAPLREAFHILENEQLLVKFPRKGTYVTEVSVERLRKIYSARKMIESYTIDFLKAEKIQNLPQLYNSVTQASQLSLPNPDNIEEELKYLKDLTDFHVKLVASTNNPWIINFYDSIVINLARFQFFCSLTPGFSSKSQATHEKVYQLLSDASYDEAKKLLLNHIDSTMIIIENHIGEVGMAERKAESRESAKTLIFPQKSLNSSKFSL